MEIPSKDPPLWIRRAAERIKAQARNVESQKGRAMRRYEHIDAHWRAYWQAVVQAVKDGVVAFNAEFPHDSTQHLHLEIPTDQELTVRRPSLPPSVPERLVRASVWLDGIRIVLNERAATPSGLSEHNIGQLTFEVVKGAGIGVVIDSSVADHLQAAEAILRPLFD